ncbi:ATP-binding protein [Ruania zhangjianzhongii]|uniref:ATP-binding protein n=1 Tax=Ruania zhangjianzhongii TaxID=2603206 RepID=UPI00143D7E76|nr:ATP-binding protein [Ruania zhangjianzhongii]
MSSDRGGDDGRYQATQVSDLAGLVAFVERSCTSVGAHADDASDVRLATEEVFVNILQHGYGGRPGPVSVRIDATPARITVTLTDEAPAFDPAELPTPDLATGGEHRALGGLGWHLVRRVMDEVRHEDVAEMGNVFTLVKELSAGPDGPSH